MEIVFLYYIQDVLSSNVQKETGYANMNFMFLLCCPREVLEQYLKLGHDHLYHCTEHLDINVYIHQLMHLFISPRQH